METVSPIDQALATYNAAVSETPDTRAEDKIAQWNETFSNLTITGVKDTEGYRKVTDAIAIVRTARLSVERKRKELKADALEFGRKVDGRARELTELIEPIENSLKEKKEIVDNEKERIKQEKELAEQAKLDGRLKKLFDLGAQFNGASYYLGDSNTTGLFVKECKDEQFLVLLKQFEAAKLILDEQKEQERLRLESERLESERIQREQEAELLRLQNEAKEKDRKDNLSMSRYLQLKKANWNGKEATYNDKTLATYEELTTWSDETFNDLRDQHNKIITDKEEQEAEQLRLQQEKIDNDRKESERIQREQEEQRERERLEAEQKEIEQRKREQELINQRNEARWDALKLRGFEVDGGKAVVKMKLERYELDLNAIYAMTSDEFSNQLTVATQEIEARRSREKELEEKYKSDSQVLNDLADELNTLFVTYVTRFPDSKMSTQVGTKGLKQALGEIQEIVTDLRQFKA